jgi:hypothetical protein
LTAAGEEDPGPLFLPAGGGWQPTVHGDGPWAVGSLHGGAVAALAATLLEQEHQERGWRAANLSTQLLRPVTRDGPLDAQVRLVRAGGRIRLVEVDLTAAGVLVSRASLLRIRQVDGVVPGDDPQVPHDAPPPDGPEDMTTAPPFTIAGPNFMSSATDLRAPDGVFGRGLAWFRLRRDVVPGVAPSPLARAAAAADFGNGLSSPPHVGWPPRITFVNADLQLSLRRDPVGPWVRMASTQSWQPDATGVAESQLWDRQGPVGSARQHLVLSPARPPEDLSGSA